MFCFSFLSHAFLSLFLIFALALRPVTSQEPKCRVEKLQTVMGITLSQVARAWIFFLRYLAPDVMFLFLYLLFNSLLSRAVTLQAERCMCLQWRNAGEQIHARTLSLATPASLSTAASLRRPVKCRHEDAVCGRRRCTHALWESGRRTNNTHTHGVSARVFDVTRHSSRKR